jgi:mannose-6-phosphate isomerase-like protein (cupin superfamily)
MRKTILKIATVAFIVSPTVALTQSGGSKSATYITAEEVQTVNKTPGVDRTIRVVDIGSEHFAVGIIHRGKTGGAAAAPAAAAAGGAGRAAGPAPEPCGERGTAPANVAGGIAHDSQTEGYYIVSGAGTMVTGGHIMNGRKSAPDAEVTKVLNGPSCSGSIMGADVVTRQVKVGDIIIIPAGTPHGWSEIPEHVDYLSFRPSAHILEAGYVHPSIKK